MVEGIRRALQAAGLDDAKILRSQFRYRSYNYGGRTDSIIKTLRSFAYLEYVKIPPVQLAGYSHILAS